MSRFTQEELHAINTADDLHIAPYHADGKTTGTPTWIWEVVVNNALYARAYHGQHSRWYQSAIKQRSGVIQAAGNRYQVHFEPISDNELNTQIDEAYRQKYSSSIYVTHMISHAAKAATIKIEKETNNAP